MRRTRWTMVGAFAVAVAAGLPAAAERGIRVVYNGAPLEVSAPPVERGGRVLVGMRDIFEPMGASVEWNPASRSITALHGTTKIVLTIDSAVAYVAGQPVELDVPPQIIGASTYVPLRFVAESTGAEVRWSGATRTVTIETPAARLGRLLTRPRTEQAAGGGSGVTLTKDLVKRFLAGMEDAAIQAIFDEIAEGLDVEDKQSPEAIMMAFDEAAGNADLDAAVTQHGFADAADFVDTARRVLPGLGIALAKVMAEMMGIEKDSDEYKEMLQDDEFAALREACGEPSDADVNIITEVLKEQMDAHHP